MKRTWTYTKDLPGWGGAPLCCPSPPFQRVPLSNILGGLLRFPSEGVCVYRNIFAARAARTLGLEKGLHNPSPLGLVWCRLHAEGVRIGDPNCPASRFLLAATLLARDGLPTIALLASATDTYTSAEKLAERTCYHMRVALERGVRARRASTTILQLSTPRPSRRLLFRFGLLEDLGLAKARSYRKQFRLTPEGAKLGREAEMALHFGDPALLSYLQIKKVCWLARTDAQPGTWKAPNLFPTGEQSLYEACLQVFRGGPGTVWGNKPKGTSL